jgi:hypothetical protein
MIRSLSDHFARNFMPAPETRRVEPLLIGYCFLLVCLMPALMLRGPAGPHIDSDYWLWSVPCAITGTGLLGWLFQRILLGRKFRLRGLPAELTVDEGWSWFVGILAAGLLMTITPYAAAFVTNRTVGVSYTGIYTVIEKFTSVGRQRYASVCYGIVVASDADPSDIFRLCVSPAEQDETVVGDKMKVKGRRTRYVNQMLSYDWIS